MKLLYLPLLYLNQNNEQKYLERAFRKAGLEVEVFDYLNTPESNNELQDIVTRFKPDVIHCQFQGTSVIRPSLLEELRSMSPNLIITQWTGDVRDNPPYIPEVVEYGKYCDITFVSNLTDSDIYKEQGLTDVRYWQNAVANPEQIGEPVDNHKGIIFCGGNYDRFNQSQERKDLVKAFQDAFGDQFYLYGPGWEGRPTLPWDEQTEQYAKSSVILGQNNVGGKEWWFSDRTLIAMASGRPFLAEYSEGIEQVFDEGSDCLFWRTIPEAVEKARWLLEHGDEAQEIGLDGQKEVLKRHTWNTRVQEYLHHIKDYQ